MADITQDLLQLQYSQSFPISGMQEADINLVLPPRSHCHRHRVWYSD